uniref:Pantothenate kinase n=1 Tax=Hyaloperonospora arabidopsidis (strain Emoy2) TaxID=559515 RepID=M4BAM5_HYAAE
MAGIELEKYDEINCTILGLHLLLTTLPDEMYTFELVSIGSGVSVLYVKGPEDYERVSGSSIGGGTYWGLCRLLTHCESYDEALDLCVSGSNQSVDMSVGDIYGGAYDKFNLPASTVASSFGKMISVSRATVSDADLARSLLVMVTQNIGQVAFLNATLYKTKNIFFVGY